MNTFVTYTLLVLASAAAGNCAPAYGATTHSGYGGNSGYAAGPAVQQVSLSSLPNIEQYLNGASSYNAPAPAYTVPAYAPSSAVVLPSGPSHVTSSAHNSVSHSAGPAYNAAPATGYHAASAPAYNAGPASVNGYGAAPSIAVQQTYASQLYPGQQNYRAYAAPSEHSRVSLPIIPSAPVARLYVPQNSYGTGASY